MKIVIINSGSSSIKYQLIEMPSKEIICSGMIDRIGLETSNLSYVTKIDKIEKTMPIANHKIGLEKIANLLMDETVGVIKSTKEINAVGGTLLGPNNIGLINQHYAGVFTTPIPKLNPKSCKAFFYQPTNTVCDLLQGRLGFQYNIRP